MKLDQNIRNLNCGDLEILLVVIGLGVTGLKITGFAYLLDLFVREGEKGWCDFMCLEGLLLG